jgi:ATP-dependent protease HslVU (ClpYQ) ATPase subunit
MTDAMFEAPTKHDKKLHITLKYAEEKISKLNANKLHVA